MPLLGYAYAGNPRCTTMSTGEAIPTLQFRSGLDIQSVVLRHSKLQ